MNQQEHQDRAQGGLRGLGGSYFPLEPSYPTKSLDFLLDLNEKNDESYSFWPQSFQDLNGQALKLTILVVGAGLGGLATAIALARNGHAVTILEQVSQLGEVGAGIQIPPNSTKLLLRWGIEPFLQDKTVEPEGISFRRWESGKVIAYTRLVPDFRKTFHAPYYVVHRAHFHDALHKLAVKLGVDVLLNHKVVDYDEKVPSVTMADGKTMSADLVVAADGVKSVARRIVLGGVDKPPIKTEFVAYRATVDVEKMKADPDIAALVEEPGLNLWIGAERHVMTYMIAAGKSFNLVLNHIDHSDPSTWKQDDVIKEMKACFQGWDPQLTKVIAMIDKTMKWPLISGEPLDSWVAASRRLVILGDAAHPMLPYMSQGAAMAVEDGAALAEALCTVYRKSDLSTALRIFESVRIKRSTQMQHASLINGMIWHFPDGPAQEARDAGMRPEVEGLEFEKSPNQWSDPETQWWTYSYDAEEEIRKAWKAQNAKPAV